MNSTRRGTAPPPTIGPWRAASVSRATEPGLLSRYEFRSVTPGVETFSSAKSMPRHHHNEGYATVVLAGFVTEVSFAGRMCAGPGDVFLHGRFDCHLDRAESRSRLQILRLPWEHDSIEGLYGVADPDALARLAESDPHVAAARLSAELVARRVDARDWVDELADDLKADSTLALRNWAERRGLRLDVVSRAFRREFGVSPKRFRLESRTRLAWRQIVGSHRSLTEIAVTAGFSDLAHLSRSIRAFTGLSPSAWRARRASRAEP